MELESVKVWIQKPYYEKAEIKYYENREKQKESPEFREIIGMLRDRLNTLKTTLNISKTFVENQKLLLLKHNQEEALEDESDPLEKMRSCLADYALTKHKQQALIEKSLIILDVKSVSFAVHLLKNIENFIRNINLDGLEWKQSLIVPIAFGLKKLRICFVVEDDKVSVDDVQEIIEGFELVQSTDIVAFNKA